ncbi:hypothetical protein ACHAPJ_007495 [Fusarium lateritium]
MPLQASSNSPELTGGQADKSRRERNREAQQQFRKRRQATEAARLQRLKRLEGVIERMSTVMVDFADKMLQEDVLHRNPALTTDVQDVITNVLALANEAGDPEEKYAPDSESPPGTSPDNKDDASKRRKTGSAVHTSESYSTPTDLPFRLDQHDTAFITQPPSEYTQAINNPPVTYAATIPDTAACSQLAFLPPSTLPPSLGPILWSSSKPLSPASFSYKLTQSCFTVGFLVLNKSPNSPLPFSEESRMFGSTLRFRERNEMMLKMQWLLGPGKREFVHAAELPWGGRFWDQEFSGDDLSSASHVVSNSPQQFMSVVGIEKQLVALGARMLDRDTLELDIGSPVNQPVPEQLQPESWSFVNFFPPELLQPNSNPTRIRVSMSLLVANLTRICVCLMKGPGFPRRELRRVIVESAVTA